MTPTVLVVPDGASEPLSAGRPTSLEAAATPALDALAVAGERLRVATTPDGLTPGTEVGLPGLLGVPLDAMPARGRMEAAAAGIPLARQEGAWRLDLVPRTEVTPAVLGAVHGAVAAVGGRVHLLRGHRMLLVGPVAWGDAPPGPHHTEQPLDEFAVGVFGDVVTAARQALRRAGVHADAWPWGALEGGERWDAPSRRFGAITVVSAGGVAAGVARLVGAQVVTAVGGDAVTAAATALRAGAALVVVHDDRPDEAAHRRDGAGKVAALEAIDAEMLGPLVAVARELRAEVVVSGDHGCDPATGRHGGAAVPAVRWHPALETSGAAATASGGPVPRVTERAVAGLPVTPAPQLLTPRPPTRRYVPLARPFEAAGTDARAAARRDRRAP